MQATAAIWTAALVAWLGLAVTAVAAVRRRRTGRSSAR